MLLLHLPLLLLLLLLLLQVTAAEGFGKGRLFEILDDLEEKTRPIMQEARQRLAKEKGPSALEPHNIGYALAGVYQRDHMFCWVSSTELCHVL
jgi:hypothetical protein